MSRSITISDDLYTRLDHEVHEQGLDSIEQLLDEWERRQRELKLRQDSVARIDSIRERLFVTYGESPDSTELVRADRERQLMVIPA